MLKDLTILMLLVVGFIIIAMLVLGSLSVAIMEHGMPVGG